MKKTLIAFVLVMSLGFSFQTADAFTSQYASFWEELFGKKFKKNIEPTQRQTTTPSYKSTSFNGTSSLATRFYNRRAMRNGQISSTKKNTTNTTSSPSFLATLSSTAPTDNIYEVNETPINVFKLGVRNNTKTSSSRLPVSAMLDKAEFQLFSKNGIFDDASDFDLVVNGESFSFDSDGKVTIKFNNTRLAEGENMELDIAIKADDPSNMAHQNGSAKLQLVNITSYEEFSRDSVPVTVNGSRISKVISYKPVSVVSSGGTSTIVSTAGSSIYGDVILPGEEKFVLAASLGASYDDLAIRKMTIRSSLTGNLIDSQIEEVQAINLLTGELLGTSRFTNGEARFEFSPRVIIARNDRGKIGFKVTAKGNPRNNGDRRFKIDLFASDVVVESLSNGRELSNANKNFRVESYVFMVMKSQLEVSGNAYSNNFSIATGSPETVYNFNVTNNSQDSAELARISLEVYPNGLQFAGGSISADDFELVELYGNREESVATNISVSGNKVVFDFTNEASIYSNSAKKFRLKVALDDLGGNSNNDGISVKIANDSSYMSNSLSSVRGSGANFIWSDESARPHSSSSNDWFSGYRLNIPSSSVYIKR